jgi:hypothetical protein
MIVKNNSATKQLSFSVNGGTATTLTYTGTIRNSSAPFCLGTQTSTGKVPWSGRQRCAGWWSRLTTAAEDTWLYNSGAARAYSELGQAGSGSNLLTNLVAYWNLGEKNGNRADSSGNGFTLTDNNTVTMTDGPASGASNASTPYVTGWADQSGNGYNLSASATSTSALYASNELNGYPGVQFDGVNSKLSVASTLGLTNGQARTIVLVYKSPTSSGQALPFVQGQSGSSSNALAIEANAIASAGTKFCLVVTGATFDSTVACDTSYHQHYVAFSTMAAASTITTNTLWRISQSTQTPTLKGGSDAFATMASANVTGLGFFPGVTDSFKASTVVEEAVFSRALSATERIGLENYFKSKYGV